jgi:hypothetical protein
MQQRFLLKGIARKAILAGASGIDKFQLGA